MECKNPNKECLGEMIYDPETNSWYCKKCLFEIPHVKEKKVFNPNNIKKSKQTKLQVIYP